MSPSQQQTALALFQKLNVRDYDGLASSFADNFTHEILPASLGGMGMPIRDKKQFLETLKGFEQLIASFNFQAPREVIDGKDVVVIHIASDGKTAVTDSPFKNEYLFIFRFDGEKIVSIKEFMDSKYVSEIAGAEQAALEKKGAEAQVD